MDCVTDTSNIKSTTTASVSSISSAPSAVVEEPCQESARCRNAGRSRQKTNYVWGRTNEYDASKHDKRNEGKRQCNFVRCGSLAASGWKRHLKRHDITDPEECDDEEPQDVVPLKRPGDNATA